MDHRWDRVCVGDILERVTWSRPDKVAITGWPGAFGEDRFQRLTYRQANDVVNQFANGLLARGLQRGDRVLLICENSVEAYLAKLGTAKAGLVAVPVNPSLATDVLAYAIRLAVPRLVVVDAQLWPGVASTVAAAGLRPDVTIPLLGSTVLGPGGEDLLGQPGVPGEAVYRSPAVCSGYYQDLVDTELAFRDGWFHSGDSCTVDEDGLRIMVDRYKDIISPAARTCPASGWRPCCTSTRGVAKAAVVGLARARPVGRGGHRDRDSAGGAHPAEQELIAFCRERPRASRRRKRSSSPRRCPRPSAARCSSTSCVSNSRRTTLRRPPDRPTEPGSRPAGAAGKAAATVTA